MYQIHNVSPETIRLVNVWPSTYSTYKLQLNERSDSVISDMTFTVDGVIAFFDRVYMRENKFPTVYMFAPHSCCNTIAQGGQVMARTR